MDYKDRLYWAYKALLIAVINIPFIPAYFAWMCLYCIYEHIMGVFRANGSSVISPIWQWPMGMGD